MFADGERSRLQSGGDAEDGVQEFAQAPTEALPEVHAEEGAGSDHGHGCPAAKILRAGWRLALVSTVAEPA